MISIVSPYYNRKPQFYRTLKSICNSKIKNFEYVVVDDGSSYEHRIEDLANEFSFLKVFRIEPENKWYVNPCVPFNIGISKTQGDVIILQSPECLYVHDILSYVDRNIDDNKYLVFSVYAINEFLTENVLPLHIKNNNVGTFLKELPQKIVDNTTYTGWYIHSKYRPAYYHFCSAITRRNMEILNGFDERYALGVAFDDDEFVARVDRLLLKKIILDDVSAIHQWHVPVNYLQENASELHKRNRLLFLLKTSNEIGCRANNYKLIL